MPQLQRREFIARSDPGEMCLQCFLVKHGIRRTTWYRIKGCVGAGQESFDHGNNLLKKTHAETLVAAEWLRDYACKCGDFMPDCDEVHLPDYCWKYVHSRYLRENPHAISLSAFAKLHKRDDDLKKIKLRKCKRFSKCKECSGLDTFIKKTSGLRRIYWQGQKKAHIDWQMCERKKLAKHVQKATSPDTSPECMVVEIDNMDNQKTAIGQMPRDPKSLATLQKLKTHITGVHIPGDPDHPFRAYTWHDRFPSGSDVVITILLRSLCEVAKKGPLPAKLYLHLDNCWRENKNRLVLGIGHLLVKEGVFKKVKICFLPVGHTHGIVDQMFSRFSVHIRWNDILSLDDLVRVCRGAYQARACNCGKPSRWKVMPKGMTAENETNTDGCKCKYVKVQFQHLDDIACWGAFLLLYLETNIHGTSKPRCFQIERDTFGIVRHRFRSQLNVGLADVCKNGLHSPSVEVPYDEKHNSWMPFNTPGLELFPAGVPNMSGLRLTTVPYKRLDIEALRKTKQVLQFNLSPAQSKWWEDRLAAFEEEDSRCAFA
jgi:hypothetical protein